MRTTQTLVRERRADRPRFALTSTPRTSNGGAAVRKEAPGKRAKTTSSLPFVSRIVARGSAAAGFGALLVFSLGMAAPTSLEGRAATEPVVLEPVVVFGQRESIEMRLLVNLPAYRLDVMLGDSLLRTFPVTIGKRGYETPTGEYAISEIIFNPWWHPPQSDWAVGRKPEAPGPRNPMGRAKLNFAPLLYIHGSSNLEALGNVGSHGCVRLANDDVIALSRMVQEFASPDSSAVIDPLVANPTRTRNFRLDRKIALEIRYDLAEVRDGDLILHGDVYSLRRNALEAEISAAFARAGMNAMEVDRERLANWLGSRPRAGAHTVAIADLFPRPQEVLAAQPEPGHVGSGVYDVEE